MYRLALPLVVALCSLSAATRAQSILTEANALLDAEQLQYRAFTSALNADPGVKNMLENFGSVVTDSLQQAFNTRKSGDSREKVISINSIRYFLQSLRGSLQLHQFELYDVPDALEKFPLIADRIFNKQSFREYITGFGARRTQLMADAFRELPEGTRLQQLADVRRVAISEDNIMTLLERRPDFPYTDTALIYVAERKPMTIVEYVTKKSNRITDHMKEMDHPVLNQLIGLSGNRNASELAPFAAEFAAGRLTPEEVQQRRSSDVRGYFRLLIDKLRENRERRLAGGPPGMQIALRNALHEKAMSFYIQPINDLHEAKERIRFASIENFKPEELYYLITSGEDELYTSSFLGMYQRMMVQLPEAKSDSLLEWVQYDQFRKFIRICSHYNVLADFLNNMEDGPRRILLSRFITGIERDTDNGIEEAMDVADAFSSLSADSAYSSMVAGLLRENLDRCTAAKSYFGIRLYSILEQVYQVANDPLAQKKFFSKLGNYELLPVGAVRDSNSIVNQLVVFYGDEDGKASYQNFMYLFRNNTTWDISPKQQWVEIRSRNALQQVTIYANLPLSHDAGLDEQAQLALLKHLEVMRVQPGIIIHRGHSYHLPTTLNYLQPYMKLAILGSCGGYKNILTVAGKSPAAQIVASKQVGSKLINDPMIQLVNDHLLQQKDIFWPEVWTRLGTQFSKSRFTRELFEEYVPPYRNLSLFVIRLYNFDAATL